MKDAQRILVAIDFSDCSRRALDYATQLASVTGAQLDLVHVPPVLPMPYPDFGPPPPPNYDLELSRAAERAMEELKIGEKLTVERKILQPGPAAAHVLQYMESNPVDVLVIGTHGRTGLAHVLMGSVATHLARLSPVPVIVVGKEGPLSARPEKFVVPVDFSETATAALETAVAEAKASNAQVIALYVVPDDVYRMGSQKQAEEHAAKALHALVQEHKDGVEVQERVLSGKPFRVIVDTAAKTDATVIVMGTEGHTGVSRLMLGSVAEKVLRTSPCPVWVIKKPSEDHPPS